MCASFVVAYDDTVSELLREVDLGQDRGKVMLVVCVET